ncbi:hypothetical protein HDU97_005325 [Phlyctochytrium planicorne]|nr:hypothetical protein HDU97_005325 [Phlyctochytrium planicorne]
MKTATWILASALSLMPAALAAPTKCVNGSFTCGAKNAKSQGTILICIDSQFVALSDCDDDVSTDCRIIGGSPYCVPPNFIGGIPGSSVVQESPAQAPAVSPAPKPNNQEDFPVLVGSDFTILSSKGVPIYQDKTEIPEPTPTESPAQKPPPVPSPSSSPKPPAKSDDSNEPYAIQGLTKCQYDIILKITSVFETSSQDLNFGICGNINDGQGISAGFIQFTTSSGSLKTVVDTYLGLTKLSNPPLARFGSSLNTAARMGNGGQVTGQGNVAGLDNLCAEWESAAKTDSEAFQTAQLKVQQDLYFAPNKPKIDSLGLKTATGIGLIFDTAIQLGAGSIDVIANGAGTPPSKGGKESDFISSFLDSKLNYINNLGGAYAGTAYRIRSYRHLLDYGIKLNDLSFPGGKAEALENGGSVMPISC